VRRLRRGENIFDAHREHRYQRLLLAGWSHRAVASLYGGMSAFGAAVALVPLFDPAVRGEASVLALATAVVEAALLVGLVAAAERRVPGFGGSSGADSA
jgi:hypothetical protein